MGAVFSHTEGFTKLSELWPAIGFHTVSSGLGMLCLRWAGIGQQKGETPATAAKQDPGKAAPATRG
jgi:hypothetical protein